MSPNWLKEINDTKENIELLGGFLLKKIIRTWLSDRIIDPFFGSDTQKAWDYIYRPDIENKANGQARYMICHDDKLSDFLGGASITTVCNTYHTLSPNVQSNATAAVLRINNVLPLDSKKLDVQAMAKIIRHRILPQNSNGNLSNWANKIIKLRNTTSAHGSESAELDWTDDKCQKTIEELIKLTEHAKNSADNEWTNFGGTLHSAFEQLENDLTDFLNAYIKVTKGITLEMSEGKEYHSDDLFTYKVLLTFVDTTNTYTERLIQELHEWYAVDKRHNHFNTDSITVDNLANESKSNVCYAKGTIKGFESQREKGSLQILETEISDLNLTELIIKKLIDSEGKWCVITGSEHLAKKIYALRNPDIVVMKVVNKNTISPFIPPKNEPVTYSSRFDDMETQRTEKSSYNTTEESSARNKFSITDAETVQIASSKETTKTIYEAILDIKQLKTEEDADQPIDSISYQSVVTPSKNNKKVAKSMPKTGEEFFNESNKKPQRLCDEITRGGEGVIYATDVGYKYVKLYRDNIWSEKRAEKISAMRAFAPELPETICWPLEAVFHPDGSNEPIGYEMINVKCQSPDAIALDELLYDLSYENPWGWTRIDLVKLCINIANNFKALHKYNIIMGDVNPKNILVDKEHRAWFIDTDSYQFSYDDKIYRCEVGTPEFSSPALHEKKCKFREIDRTLSDEYFAINCLFFQILFLGESPFPTEENIEYSIINRRFRLKNTFERRHNYKWGNLTKNIQKIFEYAFTTNDYSDESRWKYELLEMEKAITDKNLSNMLDPTSAPQSGKSVKRTDKMCRQCGKTFEFFENDNPNPDDKLCPSCKKNRSLLRTKILKLKCTKCGAIFTVNKWDMVRRYYEVDLTEFDTDNALCPDCDKFICVPNEKKFTDSNSEIENAMRYAYNNSNLEWRLLMYGDTKT